uniref:hypothetical protein n=2 Tax=uncultured Chryseobacterium sp. TaxID=259322 RepID=UPI0025D864FA
RAPISQIDSNGYATFTPASIGLTTKGYNPGAARVSDGSVGLKLSSYKYNGPITEAAQMEGVKDMPENSENQKFSTTKRGLEMTSKLIKNYNKLNNVASGAQELYKLGDLAASIPDAIKSMDNYIQASKDVLATETQAKTMDQAIKYVDSSSDVDKQIRNDVINYIFDGTLPTPEAGMMPNSLIISKGIEIMNANKIPIQSLDDQLNTNKKVLP